MQQFNSTKTDAEQKAGNLDAATTARAMGGTAFRTPISTTPRTSSPLEPPFVVEVRQIETSDGQGGGAGRSKYRPESVAIATPALRTSGFLSIAPPDVLRDVLTVLTLVTPNGFVSPTLKEIADAMRIPERSARARMRQAAQWQWDGRPAVAEIIRESGLNAYVPSPRIVQVRHIPVPSRTDPEAARYRPAGRDAVIAWSRLRYARPLEEVEKIVEHQLHGSQEFAPPVPDAVTQQSGGAEAYRAAVLVGVSPEEAERLILAYGAERVKRQADWLPYRHARRADRYLVAAVERDYAEPPQARDEALLRTAGEVLGVSTKINGEEAPFEREIAAILEDANLDQSDSGVGANGEPDVHPEKVSATSLDPLLTTLELPAQMQQLSENVVAEDPDPNLAPECGDA